MNKTQVTGNAAAIQSDVFQKDKKVLEESYNELRSENEALRKENERLKSQFDKRNADFNVIQERYAEIQGSLIRANNDFSRLSLKSKELCQKVREKGGEC